MTLHTNSGPLPQHQYVWIQPNAIGKHDWLQGVWFGLVSYPGRTWGAHVMLESGAVYRNVPLHHLASTPDTTESDWKPWQAQTWDCYGYQFSMTQYPFLAGMTAKAKLKDSSEVMGQYLFTAIPIGDGFSAEPTQAKEFYFLKLNNGRYTAQPTNHLLIEDRSFCYNAVWPDFLTRQNQIYSAEN